MYDLGHESWGDPPPFGTSVFVVTHRSHADRPMQGGTTYHFVTRRSGSGHPPRQGIGGDKNVNVAGGAKIGQELINAGLIYEVHIHLVPLFLGGGVRLFENMDPSVRLNVINTVQSPDVTHIVYAVEKP